MSNGARPQSGNSQRAGSCASGRFSARDSPATKAPPTTIMSVQEWCKTQRTYSNGQFASGGGSQLPRPPNANCMLKMPRFGAYAKAASAHIAKYGLRCSRTSKGKTDSTMMPASKREKWWVYALRTAAMPIPTRSPRRLNARNRVMRSASRAMVKKPMA